MTLALLMVIFVNAYIGARTGKDLGLTIKRIVGLGQHQREARPVLELPGDPEVGVHGGRAGNRMIIGYTWRKLFGEVGEKV